jgi:hypothetical protein
MMGSKSRLNFAIDFVAGVAFIASVLSGKSYYVHVVSGVAMATAIIIHLVLHWNWVVDGSRKLLRGTISGLGRTRLNYTVDMFIAAMFTISVTSGAILMTSNAEAVVKTHGLSSWLFVLGVVLHLRLHWRWIVAMSRELIRGTGRDLGRIESPIASLSEARGQSESGESIVSAIGEIPRSGKHEGEIA